jgi:tetratricopeptide (TPR) repeat protein
LHDLRGAHTYLEQAILVTRDPVAEAELHERAVVVAGEAALFARALEHAEAAVDIYEQRGDRLGVIRARARQATVHHMEHHEQIAITVLRDLIAEAADLGPTPEIAQAKTELARALMLSGSTAEATSLCDEVLADQAVATDDVLLEAIITKGTALTNEGRVIEAEALLRGAIPIADANRNLPAALRSRNNLRVLLQWSNLRDALALGRELRDLALKYGQRGWILHGVASANDVTFRLGDWDATEVDVIADFGDPGDFYATWLQLQARRIEVYRGDPEVLVRLIDEALQTPAVSNSSQAVAWNLAAKADALVAAGRFEDAFATAHEGWQRSGENELGLIAGVFAAAGAGHPEWIGQARAAQRDFSRVASGQAFLAMCDSLVAALGGDWESARESFLRAESLLEEVGEGTLLARLRLAVGHLASGRFPEADAGLAAARAWFAERGADAYATRYLAAAARPVARPRAAPEPAAAVRSGE